MRRLSPTPAGHLALARIINARITRQAISAAARPTATDGRSARGGPFTTREYEASRAGESFREGVYTSYTRVQAASFACPTRLAAGFTFISMS
jgi:hypothetical protein